MKCLVTGGAGFIGSHLVELLVSNAHQVVVFDNFSTGKRENLHGSAVKVIEGDIRQTSKLAAAMRGIEVVFHLASLNSPGWAEEEMSAVNVTGTMRVLDACIKARVRRVVAASSCAVYGNVKSRLKHEYMETNPSSPYALSKLLSEFYCQAYWNNFGLETVILRYFHVFGPRQSRDTEHGSLIRDILAQNLNKSQQQKLADSLPMHDFIYVENAVQASLLAATSPSAVGQIINVACPKSPSLLDMPGLPDEILTAAAEAELFGRRNKGLHTEVPVERAKALLGYTPSVSFEAGIRKTALWLQSHLEPATLTEEQIVEVEQVPQQNFPLVQKFLPLHPESIPLQIRNWLRQTFPERKVRQIAPGAAPLIQENAA